MDRIRSQVEEWERVVGIKLSKAHLNDLVRRMNQVSIDKALVDEKFVSKELVLKALEGMDADVLREQVLAWANKWGYKGISWECERELEELMR